jgi:hypothetical protein
MSPAWTRALRRATTGTYELHVLAVTSSEGRLAQQIEDEPVEPLDIDVHARLAAEPVHPRTFSRC